MDILMDNCGIHMHIASLLLAHSKCFLHPTNLVFVVFSSEKSQGRLQLHHLARLSLQSDQLHIQDTEKNRIGLFLKVFHCLPHHQAS